MRFIVTSSLRFRSVQILFLTFLQLREIMVLYPKNIMGVHDEEMNTLLIAAAQSGHKDIVQLFLNLGCDVNAQNVFILIIFSGINFFNRNKEIRLYMFHLLITIMILRIYWLNTGQNKVLPMLVAKQLGINKTIQSIYYFKFVSFPNFPVLIQNFLIVLFC